VIAMSKNYKTSDLVVFVREEFKHHHTSPVEEMIARAETKFPGVEHADLGRAFDIAMDYLEEEHNEATRNYALEAAQLEQMGKMYDGLPPGTTFGEAVEIKAAQGDQWAIAYLAFEKSPARRIYCALADAAYAAHPQFEQRDDGVIYWLGGEGNGPTEAALIDWFQRNHPAEARAIERAIDMN